ncbi:MAG: type II secretion system ATPase GspE [Chromatiales bacterium]
MNTLVEQTTHEASSADFGRRLGAWLVERGKLKPQALEQTLRLPEAQYEETGSLLARLGMVAERDIAQALAALTGAALVTPDEYPAVALYEEQLAARFLKEARAIPIADGEEGLVVAMAAPQDAYVAHALELACGRAVLRRTGIASEITAAIDRLYGANRSAIGEIVDNLELQPAAGDEDIKHLKDLASEAPVVRLVNLLINQAVERNASDIHIEPFADRLRVRFRIDGVLREVEAPPARSTAAVISRIKLIAKLNIAERRLPQDGRIPLRVQGKDIDLRASTVPTLYGESVVLRILDRESVTFDYSVLGFAPDTEARLRSVIGAPHGILLVTGPTGSGKTTTLYTALTELNVPGRKLLTVEDPIEYQLEGVNQIQVKPHIGLTFAHALRSIMRQDPDVIMIGEMRDEETARIAVQSALTGHLVLSTLHTNDAGSSITRLIDMGIEDYLVTSTVRAVLAQRLVRRLCTNCRSGYSPLPELLVRLAARGIAAGDTPAMLYEARGCGQCAGTGYRGRVAIIELMIVSDKLRQIILDRGDAAQIERAAVAEGMRTAFVDGFQKAVAGVTSIEEVLRATQEGM